MIIGFILIILSTTGGNSEVVDGDIYTLSECFDYKAQVEAVHPSLQFDCVPVMRDQSL